MPSKIDLYLSICNTFQKRVNKIKRYGCGGGGGGGGIRCCLSLRDFSRFD